MSQITMKENEKLETDKSAKKEEQVKSMWQIVVSQFLEHKFAVGGLIVIVLFTLISLCAPLISHYMGITPSDQDVFNRYKPMGSVVEFSDDKKESSIANFYEINPARGEAIKSFLQEKYRDHEAELEFQTEKEEFFFSLHEILNEEADLLREFRELKHPELTEFLTLRDRFFTKHWLGTDELGRDVLMRLIYGARVSLGIGVMVAIAAAIIGLLIGAIAGFYGGIVDTILMRVTDSLLSLPLLPFLIVLAAIDLKKLPVFDIFLGSESESIFKLVVILCLFSWMTVSRLVRGSILSLKEQEFIHAAKTLGAKDRTIILTHIFPNVVAPLLVAVTLNIGASILSEAALSFLGLGVQPPVPSWGNMLFNAQEIIYESPSLAILPGLMILIVVISFNFFGDGLQDAIDPKSVRR
jgi:peptide/nickel transport system permease protein